MVREEQCVCFTFPSTRDLWCCRQLWCGHSPPWLPYLQPGLVQGKLMRERGLSIKCYAQINWFAGIVLVPHSLRWYIVNRAMFNRAHRSKWFCNRLWKQASLFGFRYFCMPYEHDPGIWTGVWMPGLFLSYRYGSPWIGALTVSLLWTSLVLASVTSLWVAGYDRLELWASSGWNGLRHRLECQGIYQGERRHCLWVIVYNCNDKASKQLPITEERQVMLTYTLQESRPVGKLH